MEVVGCLATSLRPEMQRLTNGNETGELEPAVSVPIQEEDTRRQWNLVAKLWLPTETFGDFDKTLVAV